MIVIIKEPTPQTVHLSTGDQIVTINMDGQVSKLTDNPVVLLLEIVGDTNIVFTKNGTNSLQLQAQNMTTVSKTYSEDVSFHLVTDPGSATPCGLKLTATDQSNIPMTSYTHIIYF